MWGNCLRALSNRLQNCHHLRKGDTRRAPHDGGFLPVGTPPAQQRSRAQRKQWQPGCDEAAEVIVRPRRGWNLGSRIPAKPQKCVGGRYSFGWGPSHRCTGGECVRSGRDGFLLAASGTVIPSDHARLGVPTSLARTKWGSLVSPHSCGWDTREVGP